MQISIIYKLLFSYEFHVYVYIYIYISYTDLSAIHKSTLQLYKCCPLDFFSINARPPKKTKRQDTKNAGIRISVNGLLARSFRAEIFGFRKSSVSESEFLDWNLFFYFFWLGENMYFSIRKCVFFVQVCVVISFGKSFVSNSKDPW